MTLIAAPKRNNSASGPGPSDDGSSRAVSQSSLADTARSTPSSSTRSASQDIPIPSVEVTPSMEVFVNDQIYFQFTGVNNKGKNNGKNKATAGETPRALGMADVNAALHDIAAGHDSRAASIDLGDQSLTPSAPVRVRRRSRSRSASFEAQVHKVNEEEPPLDAFNDPDFQDALHGAKNAVKDLGVVLGTSSFLQGADSKMRVLRTEAETLAAFEHPATRNVGFVGDSGVGKSSLLNSLLDRQDLARASSNGAACTCVVTEYCYEDGDELRVESELATEEELLEQLTEMLHSYRQFKLSSGELDASEQNVAQERAERAEDTFRALFRGRLDNLSSLSRGSQSSVLDKFRRWISELQPSLSDTRASGLTAEECAEMLKRLSSESPDLTVPAVWPYLRKIRVFLNAHILEKGLVLTDLPGLRDMNSARRRITENYLWKCDEIFIVCQIGRATTDDAVNEIFKLAQTAKVQVGIVCTMSEEIEPNEAKNDWPEAIAQQIRAAQHTIETEEREVKHIEREIREIDSIGPFDELEEEDKADLNECRRRQSDIQHRLNRHKLEQIQHLMGLRNDMVMESLRSTYLARATQDNLPVYCVSNKMYRDRRYDVKEEALPYLRLSGIIALRRHCIAIVSASQHQSAVHYLTNEIPELLGKIKLWVQSGAGSLDCERKEIARNTCDHVEKLITGNLQGSSANTANISRVLKRQFKTEVYDSNLAQNLLAWNQTATEAAFDWSGWAHQTYAAFCRNDGCHYTATAGFRDWNTEAIQSMVKDLTESWEEITSSLDQCQESAFVHVETLNNGLVEHLWAQSDHVDEQIRPLGDVLHRQSSILSRGIETCFRNLETELRTLRLASLTGNMTSFMGKAMSDAYAAAKHEGGTGSHRRRKAIIGGRVSQPELFRDIMNYFQNGFDEHADTLQDEVDTLIASFLERLRFALDIIRNDNVAEESERDPLFRERVAEAVKATSDKLLAFKDAAHIA